jgi:ATP-binding cassette subfamily B protein
VFAAILFLVIAKLAAVAVPLLLKRMIDALSQPGELARLPLYLLAGYALVRFLSTLFGCTPSWPMPSAPLPTCMH